MLLPRQGPVTPPAAVAAVEQPWVLGFSLSLTAAAPPSPKAPRYHQCTSSIAAAPPSAKKRPASACAQSFNNVSLGD
eukprot:1617035-Heterocapsa_arctica.AAC.1